MAELKIVRNATCTFCGCVCDVMAFQGVGEVTCSLGEVKNRADLVIFWGSNPAESHPRHWGRYSTMPKGLFAPNGRKDRTGVLVDGRRSKLAPAADLFLQIKPRKDFEALWALHRPSRSRAVEWIRDRNESGDSRNGVIRCRRARVRVEPIRPS
jgi:formylmethanofuran dehydrogenase subunit B